MDPEDAQIRDVLAEFGWHPHPELAGDGVLWNMAKEIRRLRLAVRAAEFQRDARRPTSWDEYQEMD